MSLALAACANGEEATDPDAAPSPLPRVVYLSDAGASAGDSGKPPSRDASSNPSPGPDGGLEGQDDGGAVGPMTVTVDAGLPARLRVLDEAERILISAKHTKYDHETFIDEATGTYNVDCSGFANFVLEQVVPTQYGALRSATKPRPLAIDYVHYFYGLPHNGTAGWFHVVDATLLQPGDVISWQEPQGLQSTDTGHVMVVAAPPVAATGGVAVLVIDSTENGHGVMDPRTINHTTGVGEGTIVLTTTTDGFPTGYRWSADPGETAYLTPVDLGHLE